MRKCLNDLSWCEKILISECLDGTQWGWVRLSPHRKGWHQISSSFRMLHSTHPKTFLSNFSCHATLMFVASCFSLRQKTNLYLPVKLQINEKLVYPECERETKVSSNAKTHFKFSACTFRHLTHFVSSLLPSCHHLSNSVSLSPSLSHFLSQRHALPDIMSCIACLWLSHCNISLLCCIKNLPINKKNIPDELFRAFSSLTLAIF